MKTFVGVSCRNGPFLVAFFAPEGRKGPFSHVALMVPWPEEVLREAVHAHGEGAGTGAINDKVEIRSVENLCLVGVYDVDTGTLPCGARKGDRDPAFLIQSKLVVDASVIERQALFVPEKIGIEVGSRGHSESLGLREDREVANQIDGTHLLTKVERFRSETDLVESRLEPFADPDTSDSRVPPWGRFSSIDAVVINLEAPLFGALNGKFDFVSVNPRINFRTVNEFSWCLVKHVASPFEQVALMLGTHEPAVSRKPLTFPKQLIGAIDGHGRGKSVLNFNLTMVEDEDIGIDPSGLNEGNRGGMGDLWLTHPLRRFPKSRGRRIKKQHSCGGGGKSQMVSGTKALNAVIVRSIQDQFLPLKSGLWNIAEDLIGVRIDEDGDLGIVNLHEPHCNAAVDLAFKIDPGRAERTEGADKCFIRGKGLAVVPVLILPVFQEIVGRSSVDEELSRLAKENGAARFEKGLN